MSVRAYRIIEIVKETEATFNCWKDNLILELSCRDNNESIIEFYKGDIEKALTNPKYKEVEHAIKAILEDFEKTDGEEYIEYYCY